MCIMHTYYLKCCTLYMSMIAGLVKVSMQQLNTAERNTIAIKHLLSNFQRS